MQKRSAGVGLARQTIIDARPLVEDVAVNVKARVGIVRGWRLVLVDFVLLEDTQACADAVVMDVDRMPAEFRTALQRVVVEIVHEVVMKPQILRVPKEREIVVIGELALRKLDVLVVRLAVLKHDLIAGGAAVLHVRAPGPWRGQSSILPSCPGKRIGHRNSTPCRFIAVTNKRGLNVDSVERVSHSDGSTMYVSRSSFGRKTVSKGITQIDVAFLKFRMKFQKVRKEGFRKVLRFYFCSLGCHCE
jgi:hypothetical protein